MQRKLILIVCILVLSISFSSSVYANTSNTTNAAYSLNTEEDLVISPLWTYILDVWQTFDISSSGRAEIVATMDTKNSDISNKNNIIKLYLLNNENNDITFFETESAKIFSTY